LLDSPVFMIIAIVAGISMLVNVVLAVLLSR
jgi:hypothetical protein